MFLLSTGIIDYSNNGLFILLLTIVFLVAYYLSIIFINTYDNDMLSFSKFCKLGLLCHSNTYV